MRWRRKPVPDPIEQVPPQLRTVYTIDLQSGIDRGCVPLVALVDVRRNAEAAPDFQPLYSRALVAFQDENGRVIKFYDFPHGAVAVTEQSRSWLARRFGRRSWLTAHLVSDTPTLPPELAEMVRICEGIATRAQELLRARQRALVVEQASATISQIFSGAARFGGGVSSEALAQLNADVQETERHYVEAARRSSDFSYFEGVLGGLVPAAGLGVLLAWLISLAHPLRFDKATFIGVFVAGALGGAVSVMTRMSSGKFGLSRDAGYTYAWILGAVRPLLGSIFGALLYAALVSHLVRIEVPTTGGGGFFFYVTLAFFAGFNERWARDMLAFTRRADEPREQREQPPSPGEPQQLEFPPPLPTSPSTGGATAVPGANGEAASNDAAGADLS